MSNIHSLLEPGMRIVLVETGNEYIPDDTPAIVQSVEEWGAHVQTAATKTGRYRAGWEEMRLITKPSKKEASGDICSTCGGGNMLRSGSCLTCQDCGSTSGCG